MRFKNKLIGLWILFLLNTTAQVVFSLEYEWHIESDIRLLAEQNYGVIVSPLSLFLRARNYVKFDREESYFNFSIQPDLYVKHRWIYGYALGEFNHVRTWYEEDPYFDENEASFVNAYLGISHKKTRIQGGLQSWQFGEGFIYANEAPGIRLDLNVLNYYRFSMSGAQIMEKSPVLNFDCSYQPGFLEEINIFAGGFQDRKNSFANLVNHYFVRALAKKNKTELFWLGIHLEKFVGSLFFTGSAIYEQGSLEINDSRTFKLTSYLLDCNLEVNLLDEASLKGFCFIASGDEKPLDDRIKSFISPSPFNQHASIFFDPEFFDIEVTDTLILPGMHWSGVIAPGVAIYFDVQNGLTAEIKLIRFFTHVDKNNKKEEYGTETDLQLSYTYKGNFTFFIEGAKFWHGEYYKNIYDNNRLNRRFNLSLDPAYRFQLGFNLLF